MEIDIIIPLYKPGRELFTLLDLLEGQSVPIHDIILMNTEEKYFEQLTYGTDFNRRYKNVRVFHLSKREFDHGRTRRSAVAKSSADIFVMMTQDAVPTDACLVERLISCLTGDVAVAYARQIPGERSSVLERFSRQFNYPDKSCVKSGKDLDRLGIKTYFCSNVCAAYRRDIYDRLGGFVKRAIFNEDMIYAATAVGAGYSIAYEARAEVVHSHDYSCGQQFHRNFDLGVSQARHPEIFDGVRSESEGLRMVKAAVSYLRENRLRRKIPYFYLQCFCKYAGYLLGKHYRILPRGLVLACTASPNFWKQ
ncbi:MAG: glycosyltransferase family 2 protein [Clostridium sp.]|nr:glycosyltransferase family 2 protein [Acetatifactor muris]MCM1527828.1 glycosyltransferase family 2 protein [Bacteroides sp.]MCM1563507.1 glycosyltransferase family 2 protein [Clostridium sp.]